MARVRIADHLVNFMNAPVALHQLAWLAKHGAVKRGREMAMGPAGHRRGPLNWEQPVACD